MTTSLPPSRTALTDRLQQSARAGGAACVLFMLFACGPARNTQSPTEPSPARAPAVIPSVPVAAPAVTTGLDAYETPGQIEFLADGTLIVIGTETLLARAPGGALHRAALPGANVTLVASREFTGVAVMADDQAVLFVTPELSVAYDGPGAIAGDAPAVFVAKEHALLVQLGTELVRLDTSSAGGDLPEKLALVAGGTRLNVTFVGQTASGDERILAKLYDTANRNLLGEGLPLRQFVARAPIAEHAGNVGYSIAGRTVTRWNLTTGAADKRVNIRCPADRELGNPTTRAGSSLLVLTCENDGIVLDAKSLAERRRIPRLVPGCDQGPYLGGEFLEDGHTLMLEGCGGTAKLDLRSGKFACADDIGLLGAPYMDGPMLGGAIERRVPAGREKVKPCRSQMDVESFARFGHSQRYRYAYGEKIQIAHASGKIELEPDSQLPVLSPDEMLFAYARGDRVVVRSLPEGTLVQEIFVQPP